MLERTHLSTHENRQTVRGTKDMNFKDRASAFMCTNASGTDKMEMAIVGKAKSSRCFRRRARLLRHFSKANAWSDSATLHKWWLEVFLPCICSRTHLPVLLIMGGSARSLKNDRGQVKVVTNPPNCTSVHQTINMGIIATTKLIYMWKLLDVKVSTMLDAPPRLRSEIWYLSQRGWPNDTTPKVCGTPRTSPSQHMTA